MTQTIKDSPEMNSPGKPGVPSQNSDNKPGESPRSNPVCLEVGVTIRSLPTEANALTQPIREEGRTVIVFDNGAVLRSNKNLPIGQTVILSNANGRDVVCRVVGGRNMPSVKGYVEIEFIEPVDDFWNIHHEADPVPAVSPTAAPPVAIDAQAPTSLASPVTSHAAAPAEAPPTPKIEPLGSGPSFDDIPGLVSMATPATALQSKTAQVRPGPEKIIKELSDYNLSEVADSTSVANWHSSSPESSAEKNATPGSPRDFMSKGLMAYEQPEPKHSASNGRMPLIAAAAVVVLAAIGGGMYFMHRGSAPAPVAKAEMPSQPPVPQPPAVKSAAQLIAPQVEAAQQPPTQSQTQAQPQPVAVDQARPGPSVAAVPAVVTGPASSDSLPDSKDARHQDKKAIAAKQPDVSTSRRPAIANLKMSSPSTPNQNRANLGEGSAPITEIASTEAVGELPSAGLLTTAGRISNPPAPPAAPAPVSAAKAASDPKLISSPRAVYPATAKQSNVQGRVTVLVNIDEKGNVASAKALNGPLLLRQAAVDSVKQWKYSPGLVDGKPAPSQVTVGVDFRMN